jgi:hypothetical protein
MIDPPTTVLLWVLHQSYGRAIELDNKMLFAFVESGNISLILGQFKKVHFGNHWLLLSSCLSCPQFLFSVVLFILCIYFILVCCCDGSMMIYSI